MKTKEQYIAYVIERLNEVLPVTSRAMFGGYGIYSEGFIIGLVDDSRLYLKVNDENRFMFEERGMGPFDPYKDGVHLMRSYYELPEDVLEDLELLAHFVSRSLDASKKAKSTKKISKKKQER